MQKIASEVRVSAPGKIILTGEHAVVYGYPAILAAVDKRLMVAGRRIGRQTEIKILRSDIPIGVGMGSSAALSVTTAAAKNILKKKQWDLDAINSQAYELEKKHHGNPSGGDNTIVTYGGLLWYRKETENFKIFDHINPKGNLPRCFLVNSGVPKETTAEMVSRVAELYAMRPQKMAGILLKMESIARKFLKSLIEGDGDWNELIKENQKYLESLGVVSESGKNLIRGIERIGGAAKVSGAGGKSAGSGILLCYHHDEEKLKSFLKNRGIESMTIKLGEEGVRIEK